MSVVYLEVEGVCYIEMHRGPAAYVLGPPPSRGRELELEGGVNACLVHGCFVRKFSCFLNNAHICMTSYIFAG